MPTDAFGAVKFGSIDVHDGNLTHVSGERGGMWLNLHKEVESIPPTWTSIYLAYADESDAPDAHSHVTRRQRLHNSTMHGAK